MNLLLSRPDRIGDVIITTSCLAPLREKLGPDARLFFLAQEPMRPLLEGHPLLDGFISLTQDRHALAATLRACRADALVHLNPAAACQLAGRAAGIPRRIGYRHRWWLDALTLTDPMPDHRRAGARHEAEYGFDLFAPLGIPAPPPETLRARVHIDERWRATLDAKLAAAGFDPVARPFVVLNPGTFSPTVRWPVERFVALAERIRGELGLAVVLVAGDAHDASVVEMRQRLGPAARAGDLLDLSGQLNLGELGWLLRVARAHVARDTGTGHLAAAVGCPIVALYGRVGPIYGPVRWRALGDPARITLLIAQPGPRRRREPTPAFWQRGFESITVDEVFAALRHLLAACG